MKDEKNKRQKQRQLYPGAPKGQFKQFKHGLSSFIEALEQDVKNKGVSIQYNTKVDDIITSQKQYKIVFNDQLEEVYDGVLVTTPHQVFLNWFGQDPAFDYFKTMDSTTVATVVLAFDEKILKIPMMVLASLSREQVIQTLPHVLGHRKMAIYYAKR